MCRPWLLYVHVVLEVCAAVLRVEYRTHDIAQLSGTYQSHPPYMSDMRLDFLGPGDSSEQKEKEV